MKFNTILNIIDESIFNPVEKERLLEMDWRQIIKGGDRENLEMMIDAGWNVNSRAVLGLTPLMLSAWYCRVDMARLLLKRGADTTLRADNDMTAYDFARQNGYQWIMDLIEKHEGLRKLNSPEAPSSGGNQSFLQP